MPSSQAKVTSAKSWSLLKSPNAEFRFSWKSFHLRHSFSELRIFYFTRTDSDTQTWVVLLNHYKNTKIPQSPNVGGEKCPAGICPSMIGGFRQFTIDSKVPVDNNGDDDDDDWIYGNE